MHRLFDNKKDKERERKGTYATFAVRSKGQVIGKPCNGKQANKGTVLGRNVK